MQKSPGSWTLREGGQVYIGSGCTISFCCFLYTSSMVRSFDCFNFYFATESAISPLIQCHRGENSFPKSINPLVRVEGLHAH